MTDVEADAMIKLLQGEDAQAVPAFPGSPSTERIAYHPRVGIVVLMKFGSGWFVREEPSAVGMLADTRWDDYLQKLSTRTSD
ncbi:MAG: hypothetical protein K8I27_13040 [Planctomycetes bacterium]|nr:hypothetical protein [Planctomycetota bacterium]